jgi:hypothetical protein
VANEVRRSEALEQNNDPRFVPYRVWISQKLGKSVREIVTAYDRTLEKRVQLSPEQFLTVHLAAKENKLDPLVLAANTGRHAPKDQQFAALVALPDNEFKNLLAGSLVRLVGTSEAVAQQRAAEYVTTVTSIRTPQK